MDKFLLCSWRNDHFNIKTILTWYKSISTCCQNVAYFSSRPFNSIHWNDIFFSLTPFDKKKHPKPHTHCVNCQFIVSFVLNATSNTSRDIYSRSERDTYILVVSKTYVINLNFHWRQSVKRIHCLNLLKTKLREQIVLQIRQNWARFWNQIDHKQHKSKSIERNLLQIWWISLCLREKRFCIFFYVSRITFMIYELTFRCRCKCVSNSINLHKYRTSRNFVDIVSTTNGGLNDVWIETRGQEIYFDVKSNKYW